MLFPKFLSVGTTAQSPFRVPVDDATTLHVWYLTRARGEDTPPQEAIALSEVVYRHADGRLVVETAMGQDIMVWLTAGAVADRTVEHLATSDRGFILYRKLLAEQMERVARGENPIGTMRDERRNLPHIEVPRERATEYLRPGFLPVSSPDFPFTLRRPCNGGQPVRPRPLGSRGRSLG